MTDEPGFRKETLSTYEPTDAEVAKRAAEAGRDDIEIVREALATPVRDSESAAMNRAAFAALSRLQQAREEAAATPANRIGDPACLPEGPPPIPDRIVIGKNGAYWRYFADIDTYSMAIVSWDNDPVEPIAVFVPDTEVSAFSQVREGAEEVSFVEVPGDLLPRGVSGASYDPVLLRVAAEAHCRHSFDHDMHVKAWVVLHLLNGVSALRQALQEAESERDLYKRDKDEWSERWRVAYAEAEKLSPFAWETMQSDLRGLRMQVKGLQCADCPSRGECGLTLNPYCRMVVTQERDAALGALREIEKLPSRRTLLLNAEAKAMHYIARAALSASAGEGEG